MISPEEYSSLRFRRNKIRDMYNNKSSFVELSKLKDIIRKIDLKLTKYELHNNKKS